MSSTSRILRVCFDSFHCLSFIPFKITPEKREELQHRANILLSFKSAKDSVMYKLNDAQSTLFNTAQRVKDTGPGGKDL